MAHRKYLSQKKNKAALSLKVIRFVFNKFREDTQNNMKINKKEKIYTPFIFHL